ncbi:MAG TPA: 3-deoxy-7-phosphoheptulonate synthase [Dehalococcoidia bacterium]|nr:3-deoxy-7-phosphoheptulonate synthase [Dehalococcoidia bacterium]
MIVMKTDATEEEIRRVVDEVESSGLRAAVIRGEYLTVIGPVGDERRLDFDRLAALPGVKEATKVEAPYKLISRDYARFFEEPGVHKTVQVGDIHIGNGEPVIIAGPCAVESKEQIMRIAGEVRKAGAHILRGGIYKPRSSVHSFQGVGSSGITHAKEALHWLQQAGNAFDMPIVTEVRGESTVNLIARYVDIMHIGARNMYDQDLLVEVARKGKPVLLKRHFGASIEELLSFSEYIAAEGNRDIILCERGIVPVGKGKSYTRYTLDLAAVPVIHRETYLPVIVDPSHGTGQRDLVFDMSCAAISAGADGLMIETHYNPAEALVDGPQMVTPDELKDIIDACHSLYRAKRSATRFARRG